jgi:hypothetical protein
VGLIRRAPRIATVRVAEGCDEAETLVVGKDDLMALREAGSGFRQRVFERYSVRSPES